MDVETSDLPTSSRPPPAGQDAIDFKERGVENGDCPGHDEMYLIKSSVLGTPQISTCQDRCEIKKKMHSGTLDHTHLVSNQISTNQSSISDDRRTTKNFYDDWRNGCDYLLADAEGRRVFYEYLSRENYEILLECLDACDVFRAIPSESDLHISARDFYKRFIQFRDPKLQIRDETRSRVNCCMRNRTLHSTMFDDVEQDVFSELNKTWYGRFLDSDYFLNYCLSVNQFLGHEVSRDQQKSKEFNMPTLYEEGNTDLRLHAERHRQYGAHGKEIKGKSMKVSDGLRRSLQDSIVSGGFDNGAQIFSKDLCGASKLLINKLPDTDNRPVLDSLTNSETEVRRERLKSREPQDNLPTLPHFKPRTERMNREAMKPMKPEEFVRILCEKLEKVIQERALDEERSKRENESFHMDKLHEKRNTLPCDSEAGSYDANENNRCTQNTAAGDERDRKSCKSIDCYPQSDRYSVAGMSSVSGSELKVESQLKYKHGAKELASAVHHALRTELKECKCKQCVERHIMSMKPGYHNYSIQRPGEPVLQSSHCSCCKHLQNQHQNYGSHLKSRSSTNCKLTPSNLENFEISQNLVDHSRIYMWMEESEKYRPEMLAANVSESPRSSPAARRRHRTPVVYNTTRPGDYKTVYPDQMYCDPALQDSHQPDTSIVLEEAKKRLEDNGRGTTRSSKRNGTRTSSRHHNHHGIQPAYAETALSTTSGNWTLSDSASSISRQQVPSVVSSSIPSSASHYLNESTSDIQTESMKSRESGSSRGHKKDKTVVTYFLGIEPIPYRTSLPGKNITLAQFKSLITKKGVFRYFFKTKTKDDGIVYQQVENDSEYLPKFENKIVVKVDKVE